MHVAGLKMPEAYDGKCNNRNKNPKRAQSDAKKQTFERGMVLEVHSSLSSFGEIEGGAETVIYND